MKYNDSKITLNCNPPKIYKNETLSYPMWHELKYLLIILSAFSSHLR